MAYVNANKLLNSYNKLLEVLKIKLKSILAVCCDLLEDEPQIYTTVEGAKVKYSEIIAEIKKLMLWCYKDLDTQEVVKIVRCKDCIYFKRYKNKAGTQRFYACSKDRIKHHREHYCADGRIRGIENE